MVIHYIFIIIQHCCCRKVLNLICFCLLVLLHTRFKVLKHVIFLSDWFMDRVWCHVVFFRIIGYFFVQLYASHPITYEDTIVITAYSTVPAPPRANCLGALRSCRTIRSRPRPRSSTSREGGSTVWREDIGARLRQEEKQLAISN